MATVHNHTDQRVAHIKEPSDILLLESIDVHPSYFNDGIVADLWFGTGVQADLGSVSFVVGRGHPFKIGDGVVGFDAVDMVDLRKVERVWDERHSHKAVDETADALTASAQRDMRVLFSSSSCDTMADDLALPNDRRPVLSVNDAVQTSDPSEIADFVEAFKASNAAPLFDHDFSTAVLAKANYVATTALAQ